MPRHRRMARRLTYDFNLFTSLRCSRRTVGTYPGSPGDIGLIFPILTRLVEYPMGPSSISSASQRLTNDRRCSFSCVSRFWGIKTLAPKRRCSTKPLWTKRREKVCGDIDSSLAQLFSVSILSSRALVLRTELIVNLRFAPCTRVRWPRSCRCLRSCRDTCSIRAATALTHESSGSGAPQLAEALFLPDFDL